MANVEHKDLDVAPSAEKPKAKGGKIPAMVKGLAAALSIMAATGAHAEGTSPANAPALSASVGANLKFGGDIGAELSDDVKNRIAQALERNGVSGKVYEVMVGGLSRFRTSSDIKVGVIFSDRSRKEEMLHLPVDCNSSCIWRGVVDWFDKVR